MAYISLVNQLEIAGIDDLTRDRRFPGIGAVGERPKNKESKQKDQNHRLNPASGREQSAFGCRFPTILSLRVSLGLLSSDVRAFLSSGRFHQENQKGEYNANHRENQVLLDT